MSAETTPEKPNPLIRLVNTPPSTADIVVLRALLVLIMIGAAVATVAALWPTSSISYTALTDDTTPAPGPAGTAANVSLAHADELLWIITDPTLGQRLLVALPVVFVAALVAVGAWLVLGIVTRISRGEAFGPAAIRRLSLVVLLGGITAPFVELASRFALSAQLQDQPQVFFRFELMDIWPIVVGMVLLLITQVFRRGAAMTDELAGVI
ncbi:DUF2975 domain-containing protein [Propionibacteriaceae bacterium G57]|uniref:DUF2975 domain-containing protein n=1 Tax=Aestuariimicrobium sp. G57 TaxID=3418485 RepID=UPI003DA6E0F1